MATQTQRGFIQNFIVPGILLLGIIIGGLAWLSHGSDMSAKPDQDRMAANIILTQAVKLQDALARATADGAITGDMQGVIDLPNTLGQTVIMPAATIPVPPVSGLTAPGVWQYSQRALQAFDAQATPQPVGTTAADDVVYLNNVAPGVCARLNNILYGSNVLLTPAGQYAVTGSFALGTGTVAAPGDKIPAKAQAGAREGCVTAEGGGFTYYKVVGVH